nr:hypothetical protein [Bradyrhizobium diazoefficiens]
MLQRGFWLYVWRVVRLDKGDLLYVGRTGDNSSPNASPPYIRMGQHLGSVKSQNALRTHLGKKNVLLRECEQFDLIAHGPIHPEVPKPTGFKHGDKAATAKLMLLHQPIRDIVGAMEKQLAVELAAAGYEVMNVVKTRHKVPLADWLPVREAFAVDFPKLRALG